MEKAAMYTVNPVKYILSQACTPGEPSTGEECLE